jgi:hypothetical protein
VIRRPSALSLAEAIFARLDPAIRRLSRLSPTWFRQENQPPLAHPAAASRAVVRTGSLAQSREGHLFGLLRRRTQQIAYQANRPFLITGTAFPNETAAFPAIGHLSRFSPHVEQLLWRQGLGAPSRDPGARPTALPKPRRPRPAAPEPDQGPKISVASSGELGRFWPSIMFA